LEDEKRELPDYGQTPPNPYGYPQYGYPPYGYSYGYPQRPTGTNGLAIAALVLGICGFLVATPIIGLIFGIVSLSAVRRSGQKGKGLAISGIVLSSAWIAIFATFMTIAVIATGDPAVRDANGTVVSPGVVSVFALQKKDCFTLPHGVIGSTHTKTATVKVVPCSTAHDSESIGLFTLADESLPTADDLHTESTKQCVQLLNAAIPDPASLPSGSRMEYLYPDQRAWDNGRRQVMCFVQFPAATMTQSVCRDPSSYTVDQMVFLDAYHPLSDAVGELTETPKTADISVLQQRANDIVYVGWVGLRGAVPIILAMFPVLAGAPDAPRIFNIVFFIVVLNAILPGTTVSAVTRWLKLESAEPPPPNAVLSVESFDELDGQLLSYYIDEALPVAGMTLEELPFPDGAAVTMIVRGQQLIAPNGATRLEIGDHAYVLSRPDAVVMLQLLFGRPEST